MLKRYVAVKGLTNLFGNHEGLLINTLGQIKDAWGNDLETTIDDNGFPVIEVCAWGGIREYRVADLVAIQFKNLQIPVEDYDSVIAFNIDGNKLNVNAGNIGYRFEGGKLACRDYPGFYYIPGYTRYVINAKGELKDSLRGRTLNWIVTKPTRVKAIKGGYYRVSAWFDRRVHASISRHRALCLVFKAYPDNIDDLVVNHIDGVPGNDTLENLEIVTRAQNNEHAWQTNLRTQNQPVLSRDVLTGQVTEHLSLVRASSDLGYGGSDTIRARVLDKPFGTVFHDGKQFKLKDDPREWVIPEDPISAIAEAKRVSGLSMSVVAKDCKTGVEATYESISEAARGTGVVRASICYRLDKGDSSPLFGYQFKLLSDPTPFPSFTKEQLEASLVPVNFIVHARNLLSGETLQFDSVKQAASYIGESALQYHLKNGNQRVYSSGWQCKYESQEWVEVDDPEEAVYRANTVVSARDIKTGKVIVTKSARDMSPILKFCSKLIRKLALTRGQQVYKGYQFRLGDNLKPWPAVQ